MVITTSEASTASVVSTLGRWSVMSMPTSAMASTAAGLRFSAGRVPAERTSTASPARWRSQPAAIWERPALCTQTNKTLGRSLISSVDHDRHPQVFGTLADAVASAPQHEALADGAQHVAAGAGAQRDPLAAPSMGLVARTIAPCRPGATSWVKVTEASAKPAAARPARYSERDRAPAMQPT